MRHNRVLVLDPHNRPLMPCHPARARQLLRKVTQMPQSQGDELTPARQGVAATVAIQFLRESFKFKSRNRFDQLGKCRMIV